MVRELYNSLPKSPRMDLVWDGKDDSGRPLPSGIYYYRMSSGDFIETRKMLMMK